MERNKFLVFCWAFIPGAGQMYLNMMKKGLAIMTLFWSIIAVTVLVRLDEMLLILPIIWFYSFFDTFNSAKFLYEQRQQMDNQFGEMLASGDWFQKACSLVKGKGPVYIAIALIFLGSYLVYRAVISPILWYITLPDWAYQIIRNIPNLVVAIAIIAMGVLMLRKEKTNKHYGEEEVE